jgi:hypothetical protein
MESASDSVGSLGKLLLVLDSTVNLGFVPAGLVAIFFFLKTLGVVELLSCVRVTIDGGFGLDIGFTDHFNIRLVTTLNYSAIANLSTVQTTRAQSKTFQSVMSSPVVPW